MKSSYNSSHLTYRDILRTICFCCNPTQIVEFGILEGFSLQSFIDSTDEDCQIHAYDIFDDFNGNGAKRDIINKFNSTRVKVDYGDFYTKLHQYDNNSIDILHIDIANNGDVYNYCIDHYLCKVKIGGIIILEGGSIERDNVEWMIKYNKPPINPVIQQLKSSKDLQVTLFDQYPSMTLVKRINNC